MNIESIRTKRIEPKSSTLLDLLDKSLPQLTEQSIVAITSKIVSLCEGNVVPIGSVSKEKLIRSQSDLYLPKAKSRWGISFTITNGKLIPNSGIDESNAGDVYVLWPKDAQDTANKVRIHLSKKYGVKSIGVVITDSTCSPMRRGVSGIALAFSGIKPLRDYVGKPDLFDRPFKVSQAAIVDGLAGAAVLIMGEGSESTPLVLFSDVTIADFVDRDPTDKELTHLKIPIEEDLFAPFLEQANWQKGGRKRDRIN